MGLIAFGKITKKQGLSGEVRVLPFSKDLSTFKTLKKIYIKNSPDSKPSEFIIERKRFHKNLAILKLEGIDSPESADSIVKCNVYIGEDQFSKLEENEYYWFQLIGLNVYTDENQIFGKVKDLMDNGAQEILIVENKDGEFLVPFVERFIKEASVEDSRIIIRNIDELLE